MNQFWYTGQFHSYLEICRVEGRGVATIHDVTISTIIPPPSPASSDILKELLAKKRRTEKTCERAKNSLTALQTYLGSLKIQNLDPSNLRAVLNSYDKAAEELDDKIAELENVLAEIDQAIWAEKIRLSGPIGNGNLNLKVSVGIFADFEGEINIVLIYGVHFYFITCPLCSIFTDTKKHVAVQSATWNAGYDIRVDMNTKDKPVALTYKGSIIQNTGEVRIVSSS